MITILTILAGLYLAIGVPVSISCHALAVLFSKRGDPGLEPIHLLTIPLLALAWPVVLLKD